MQNNKLYVGNLSFKMTQPQLRAEFASCGEIETIRLIKDRKTGRSKGFAFITFADAYGAEQALMKDGVELEGRVLKVNIALEKTESGEKARPAEIKKNRQSGASAVASSSRVFDWIGGIIVGSLLTGLACWII